MDPSIDTCRGQVMAVAAKHNSADCSALGAERSDLPSVPRFPDFHGSACSSRYQAFAVGAECHGLVLFHPGRENVFFLLCVGIPDLDLHLPAVTACEGEPLAVGMPGHAEDNFLV